MPSDYKLVVLIIVLLLAILGITSSNLFLATRVPTTITMNSTTTTTYTVTSTLTETFTKTFKTMIPSTVTSTQIPVTTTFTKTKSYFVTVGGNITKITLTLNTTSTVFKTVTLTKTKKPLDISSLKRLEISIIVSAKGMDLHYQEMTLWDKEDFSKISSDESEFMRDLMESFEKKAGEYGLRVTNYKINFNEQNQTTIFECDVLGATSKSGNTYTARFEWLLKDKGFDLYSFKRFGNALVYRGEVNGIQTSIALEFPSNIGHCRYHVWWKL